MKNTWKPVEQMDPTPHPLGTNIVPFLGKESLCAYFSFKEACPCFLFQNLKHTCVETIKCIYLQHLKNNLGFHTIILFKVKLCYSHIDSKLALATPHPNFQHSPYANFLPLAKWANSLHAVFTDFFLISKKNETFSLYLSTKLAFGWYSGLIRNLAYSSKNASFSQYVYIRQLKMNWSFIEHLLNLYW